MMKAIDKRKYVGLSKDADSNPSDLLIYGRNQRTGRNELVAIYHEHKGIEALYNLKSVLTKEQIKTVREWISEFNPKFKIQL